VLKDASFIGRLDQLRLEPAQYFAEIILASTSLTATTGTVANAGGLYALTGAVTLDTNAISPQGSCDGCHPYIHHHHYYHYIYRPDIIYHHDNSVIPIIEGKVADGMCVAGDIPFNNLDHLTDDTLLPASQTFSTLHVQNSSIVVFVWSSVAAYSLRPRTIFQWRLTSF
jgi:hypothetical protein